MGKRFDLVYRDIVSQFMQRDIDSLKNIQFDMLIIGGGITGACIARDAALRGLSVALIEKKDFGHASSGATSKMIHGGLRYLSNLEFKVVRESLRERRYMERAMPHLAFPLPFLLPVYKYSDKPQWMIRLGLSIYDLLSFDKNFLDDPDKYLSNHSWISKEEALFCEPGLNTNSLKGAFFYYDVQNRFAERANLEYILSASEDGAVIANYVEAKRLSKKTDENGVETVNGVVAEDLKTGMGEFNIQATVTINCSGPWGGQFASQLSKKPKKKVLLSKGIHLLFPKINQETALTIETKDHKHFFIIPWLSYTLIGTTNTTFSGDLDSVNVTKTEALDFIKTVNEHYPANLSYNNVLHAYAGIRPLVTDAKKKNKKGTYNFSRKHSIIDHKKTDQTDGLYSVFGGKWTTSRSLAKIIVDKVTTRYNMICRPCMTDKVPVSGGRLGLPYNKWKRSKLAEFNGKYSEEIISHILSYYGANYTNIIKLFTKSHDMQKLINGTSIYTRAQVVHAVENEMSLALSDFMNRRCLIGNTGVPPMDTITDIATLMGSLLGWTKVDIRREIENYIKENTIADA